MQFNTKTKKLTLTKREQETLGNAKGILSDAGRITGNRELVEMGNIVGNGLMKLCPKEEPLLASPSGDTSDPFPPSTPVKK